MTGPPRLWVFNLDADSELATRGHYTPAKRVHTIAAALRPHLMSLLGAGDVVLEPSLEPSSAGAASPSVPPRGVAWCPTSHALRQLGGAGAMLPRAPSMAVLRRVNHRQFCHALGPTLDGAAFVYDNEQLARVINERRPELGWLLKRPFSTSGSGRRHIVDIAARDEGWLAASWRLGGLQVEPLVARVLDVSMHGYLDGAGRLTCGRALRQLCDVRGRWRGAQPLAVGELAPPFARLLQQELVRVAAVLVEAGYFGPFGIDAFVYRDGGCERFNPRCEINARYSMNWAMGMAGQRPDLVLGASRV